MFDFLKHLGIGQKAFNPNIFSYFYQQSSPKLGEKQFLDAYKGWVFACVNAIAEEVGNVNLRLQKKTKDSWEEVPNHPALTLLRNVNNFTTSSDLLMGTQAFLELDGNAFWYMVRNGNNGGGDLVEIWLLDPTRTSVVKDPKTIVGGYVYQNEKGDRVPLTIGEIIHFKKFNPKDSYRGIGTVQAAALPIDIDDYSAQWQRNFFANAAMPSGILSTDGTLNQEQYDRIKANWDAKYKGVANSNKMALLEGGLHFTPVNFTQREMQFLDGRRAVRDEILGIFRVPKSILGIVEDVNRANAEASDYVFGKRVVKPKMEFLVDKLNEFYLPMFGLKNGEYRFDFDDPVPQNQDLLMTQIAKGLNGASYLTINEAREQMGYPPLDQGGDEIFISNGVMPLGTVIQSGHYVEPKGIKIKDVKPKKKYKIKINTKARSAKRQIYFAQQITKLNQTFVDLNNKLKGMLLTNLRKKKAAWILKKDQTNNLVKLIFANYNDWIGLLFNATRDGMTEIMNQSGKDALSEVQIDLNFDLQNPRAQDWLNSHALENTTSYSDSVKEEIALKVQEGVEQGASVDDIAGGINDFFDEQGDWRALRLARTETADAYSQGNLEGYRQSGVVMAKFWLADDSACEEICQPNADAGEISIDENFPSGDDAPPGHPNCECALQPVTGDDSGN